MLRLLQAVVYSGCLAFWVVAFLASLRFAVRLPFNWPNPDRRMFGAGIVILSHSARILWGIAMLGMGFVSIQQVLLIWKAVMML